MQFYCIGGGPGGPKTSQYLVWPPFASCSATHRLHIELIKLSRASQKCSMGDMSGEYAGHARTGMFSASRNCIQILATWGLALRISSRYLCAFKMSSISITLPAHTITPPPPWATRSTKLTSANRSPTQCHTCHTYVCLLPYAVKTGIHPWR